MGLDWLSLLSLVLLDHEIETDEGERGFSGISLYDAYGERGAAV